MAAFVSGNSTDERVDERIVVELTQMLDNHNSLARAFRMARDWCEENNNNNCELRLLGQRTTMRQYNKPTVSEVAVLITNEFGENTEPRDVIVSPTSGGLKRISELHQLYMALQYPLLFPYGETGYHNQIPYHRNIGRRKTKRETVTMREFYCYRYHYRNNEGTTLLRGGRLYQQYLVDSYTAVEEEQLRYTRNHQAELRVDLYNNVCDAVTKGDTRADAVGKRIVLPTSFTGSPRYMVQNYQDVMALCRAFVNPDLFITFTANPKWPEIDKMVSLISGHKSHDRSESVTRIFKMKLDLLMEDIMQKKIFGECKTGIYTIEFQKRGLPHAHILIWLGPETKCNTPEEINDIISAELPLESEDPDLYEAVLEFMLHGPCGADSPNASCTEDGKCKKHFPRPFYQETTIDADGYPVYQRRNNRVFVQKGKTKLHNGFVVPYNRYLLLKYKAHINVEWCNRSRAIKYLFKYLNKGPDRATIVIHENVATHGQSSAENILIIDEIKNYLDCRYLSPCEAVWRMLAFSIHYSYPSVIRLTFHLPEQHMITLRDSENLRKKLNEEGIEKTMFTEWKGCIGRIVYCNPAAGPRYYLRILLSVVRGPQSYKDIKTVNGPEYATYKEACIAYGLLNDDKEWTDSGCYTDAINEAKLWATGSQLRDLFVTILMFCDVRSPLEIWNENWETLSEDILYRLRRQFKFPNLHLSDEQIKNYCLVEIQEILQRNGKSLDDFSDIPKPDETLLTAMDNRLIREELSYNQSQEALEHEQLFHKLNPDQMTIYENVIASVHKERGGFYFVYGPGGTGKTFLYKTILSWLRSEGTIALAVASSGIASLLLPGGRITHSRFVIPLELMEYSTCGIKQKTHLAALMQQAKLIIWDEAPMTQKYAFEALDKTLKDILGLNNPRNRTRIFEGLTVLLGWDFRQILPVIPKGQRQEIVHSCINKSILWKCCQLYTLSRSMRVNEYSPTGELDRRKQQFNKWVLDIGDGVVEQKQKKEKTNLLGSTFQGDFLCHALHLQLKTSSTLHFLTLMK
uniref:uncharacterized protein LOC122589793 n=1 Tax=Erigeron canadensis TaxID=72917 RepID=UPI001CB8C3CA|nr:uncharacterized protein LOC122589793 [Erigeron canadensis]